MAIEIDTAYSGTVVIEGEAADRFMDEVKNPSSDPRRLEHLERSTETTRELLSDLTANEIMSPYTR